MDLKATLFDFDGTLINSGPGILETVKATAAEMGLPIPKEAVLRKFIGPPLLYSFMRGFDMSEAQAEQAALIYRRIAAEQDAYKDAYFYPGILDLVRTLRARGVLVAIASAKRRNMIETTLAYFGCRDLFDFVCGAPDGDEVADKPAITRRALELTGVQPSEAIMMGDSDYDADAAHLCRIPFCAVLWGYGFDDAQAAEAYHPDFIAATVPDLAKLLLKM